MQTSQYALVEKLVLEYQDTRTDSTFAALYQMHYAAIFDYTNKIVKRSSVAFDITQDTFIIAAEKIGDLRNAVTFKSWIFRIARNLAFRHVQIENRQATDLGFNTKDDLASVDTMDQAREKEDKLNYMEKGMETLSTEEQFLLTQMYFENKSVKELMILTSLGSSAVKMKIHRARKKLQDFMTTN